MLDIIVVGSWVVAHLFVLPVTISRAPSIVKFCSLAGLLLIILALALKPNTYDLIAYLDYFSEPFPTDIGFYFLSSVLVSIGLAPVGILLLFQLLIAFILYLVVVVAAPKKDLGLSLFLVFGSLFFILASQNILRQGLSVCLAMLAYVVLLKNNKRFLTSSCLVFISLTIHIWTIILLLLMALEFLLNSFGKNSLKQLYCFSFGLLLGLVSLFIVGKLGASEIYLDANFSWEGNRTSSMAKLAIYAAIFFTTHYLVGNLFNLEGFLKRIYSMRILIFSFSLPLAIYGEVFSRIQVFFYAFEALILIWLYFLNKSRAKFALIFIAIAYAFAPNALNILTLVDY
jgi:EpsG family